MSAIYLDYSATTPLHPAVIETLRTASQEVFGNPSSIHQFGQVAEGKLQTARETIAQQLHCRPNEIIFTSGGTESDNQAIIGTALARKSLGNHLITTEVEHPAVLQAMRHLEKIGFAVTYLPVDEQGELACEQVAAALRPETILVSIMAVNNETGVKFPLKEIGELLATRPAYFHVDAVQAFGHETIDVEDLGIDLLSVASHKINGPKGVGALYKKQGIQLEPLFYGGMQENKQRPGTENLPGILGFATATSILTDEEMHRRQAEYQTFATCLTDALTKAAIPFAINGEQAKRSAHVLNVWFKDVPNQLLLMQLDLQGVAVSTGSACTAGTVDPSHVLEAMYGKGSKRVSESLRFSFGYGLQLADIEQAADKLVEGCLRLKKSGFD